jgi:membrane-associated HD superfamily phosphohydrolase
MPSQLQTLSNQFNVLLTEYQDTSKKYTDLININDNTLVEMSDAAFIGERNLNILGESNVSACKSECSANKSCSGATFDLNVKNCTLFSGTGSLVPTKNSVAIVQQAIKYSTRLKELNTEMTNLIQQMNSLSNENYKQFYKNSLQTQQQGEIIQKNNTILIKERKVIDNMVSQFQTLNAAYEDGNTHVNSNYTNYIVFLFVAIFLVLLLIRFSLSGPQNGGGSGNKIVYNRYIPIAAFFIFFVIIFYKYILQNK